MDERTEQNESKGKAGRRALICVIALLVILLLLVGSCGIGKHMGGVGDAPEGPQYGVGLVVDPNAGEFVDEAEPAEPEQGVAIPGWGAISLEADTTNVHVEFFNPEANADMFYLTFELRLKDDSEQGYETLYTSGLVEPGLYLRDIVLSRPLEAGTYEGVVHIQPYRMDEELTPTNNADIEVKLVVG